METASVSRELLQSHLNNYGEIELASRVPSLDNWQMHDICVAASGTPIRPIDMAYALVAVEFFEGTRRPLKSSRRPQKEVCSG